MIKLCYYFSLIEIKFVELNLQCTSLLKSDLIHSEKSRLQRPHTPSQINFHRLHILLNQ